MICLVGLQSRQAVVVGGGLVAAQKIQGLLAAEVQARVISPALVPEIQALVDEGKINHIPCHYQDGDLKGAFLAVAATDDPDVNRAVWVEAQARGCLVNVVDDPEHCTFILPAVVRRGELNIAISTGGSSPALARWLRERIETIIGTEYGTLTEILAELRPDLMASFPAGKARLEAALRVINSDILKVITEAGKEDALAYARKQLHSQQ
jgi:precorrin-2 dehydrogenase/sirohydrochlorin ferrochelatase